jgi:hypothetical protein
MPDDRLVNELFIWKPIASRSQGRPNNRWECILDRINWKAIAEKAKTLKG